VESYTAVGGKERQGRDLRRKGWGGGLGIFSGGNVGVQGRRGRRVCIGQQTGKNRDMTSKGKPKERQATEGSGVGAPFHFKCGETQQKGGNASRNSSHHWNRLTKQKCKKPLGRTRRDRSRGRMRTKRRKKPLRQNLALVL